MRDISLLASFACKNQYCHIWCYYCKLFPKYHENIMSFPSHQESRWTFFDRGGIFFCSAGSSLWKVTFEYFGNDNSNEAKADTCEWK